MKWSARVVISASTIIGLILSTLPVANAKVSVNVSNNGEGGDSSTHVEINQNGEKKVFDTRDGEVHYQSPDGTTKVDISNKSGASVSTSNNGERVEANADVGNVSVGNSNKKKAKREKKKAKKDRKKGEKKNKSMTESLSMRFSLAEFLLGLWPF